MNTVEVAQLFLFQAWPWRVHPGHVNANWNSHLTLQGYLFCFYLVVWEFLESYCRFLSSNRNELCFVLGLLRCMWKEKRSQIFTKIKRRIKKTWASSLSMPKKQMRGFCPLNIITVLWLLLLSMNQEASASAFIKLSILMEMK